MAGQRVENFRGEITVSSRVIDQLSSGLYESPSACLKELVNNSYDADAENVSLFIRPDADTIVIEDDGDGLSRQEFERHFKRIAQSHKRDVDDSTSSGRPKIGKIGIGFIAANEICDRMEIESSKQGSTDRLLVEIDFAVMRQDLDERERSGKNLAKADFKGSVSHDAAKEEHYTRIFLRDVRGEARDILAGAKRGGGDHSLYGLKSASVRRILGEDRIESWDQFDTYSRSCLEIALNVPVRYHAQWHPSIYSRELTSFTTEVEKLNFAVTVDGAPLFKPTVLRDDQDGTLLRTFSIDGSDVGGHGYFYARSGVLRPRNLNGLLIRIRNAAVGGYDDSFIAFPGYQSALFQDWTSGEFWADDRLEDALNIDRRTLRTTHPAYVELREEIHTQLRIFLADVRRELYGRRSQRRKSQQAAASITVLDDFAEDLVPIIGSEAANRISNAWHQPPTPSPRRSKSNVAGGRPSQPSSASSRRLTRNYSLAKVLNVARDAAREAKLTPRQTAALIEYMTANLLE